MPKPPKILISDPDVVSELLRKSIQEGVDLHDEEFFWALVDTFADQPDYLQGLDINKRFEQFVSNLLQPFACFLLAADPMCSRDLCPS